MNYYYSYEYTDLTFFLLRFILLRKIIIIDYNVESIELPCSNIVHTTNELYHAN